MIDKESREEFLDRLRSAVYSCVSLIRTDVGRWEGQLITTDQAKSELYSNPVATTLLTCWASSTLASILADPSKHLEDQFLDVESSDLEGLVYLMGDMVVEAVVTTHNLELADIN